jgi:hypothetical protein
VPEPVNCSDGRSIFGSDPRIFDRSPSRIVVITGGPGVGKTGSR